MLEAANVLALHPKITVLPVASDYEQNTSEGSAAQPIYFSLKKKPRSDKVKQQNNTTSITALVTKLTSRTTESVPVFQVFAESEQPIKVLHILAIPSTAGSPSHQIHVPRLKGVVLRDPLPETTISSLIRPSVAGQNASRTYSQRRR